MSIALSWGLDAAPVSAGSARRAADRWLRLRPAAHMKARFGARKPAGVKTFRADGEDAFHIVSIEGGGFIVVSADDRVEPVVAFTDSGTLDEDPKNPLWALLSADVPQRVRAHRRGTARHRRGRRPGEEWKELLSAAATAVTPQANGQSSVADVRVEPLVQSKWNQSNVSSKKCYNYYTPNGYVCGCVATAGAQLMRYHRFPTAAVSPVSRDCWVDKTESRQTMMGGVYDWDSMPLVPGSSTTEAQRQAIGKLCYDVGVATRMSWASGSSGACPAVLSQGYTEIFGYASSKCQLSSVDGEVIENAIFANLDAKCPVLLGISGTGGHEIVADGYGCYEGSFYTHLNLGWAGSNDAWYLLPSVSTSSYDYDSIDSVVYNVFPTESAELLTGRVTDVNGRPVVGATVTGTKDGTTRSARTDEHGVYALRVSKGKWTVDVSVPGGTKRRDGSIDVGTSKSSTLTAVNVGTYSYLPLTGSVGNRWGNDVVLPDYEAPKLQSVAVVGPSKLKPNTSATFVCAGRFADGAVRPIATARWSLSDNTTKSKKEWWDIFGINVKTTTYATMDTPGVLTAKTSGKTVTLSVTGTENDVSQSASRSVEIVDEVTRPANDAFSGAIALGGESGSAAGSNVEAIDESGEPLVAFEPSAVATVWWTWTAPFTGEVQVDTVGSGIRTVLGVYSGSSVGALTKVAESAEGGCVFACTAGTAYRIAVAGYCGETGSVVLNWTRVALASLAIEGPAEVNCGESAAFRCRAAYVDGTEKSVQAKWSVDDEDLATVDAASGVLTVKNLDDSTFVRVTAEYAEGLCVKRTTIAVRVGPKRPENDDFACAAEFAGLSGSADGSSVHATLEDGEPLVKFKSAAGRTVWWRWTAPAGGTAVFDTKGTGFDTVMGVYTGASLAALAAVAQDDDGGGSLTSRCAFECAKGTTYFIAVGGYSGKCGAVWLNWSVELPPVVPSLADLRTDFADDPELLAAIADETELAAFNDYLRACGVERVATLTEGQRRWAYRSYRMSALASVPELYEEEPELKISKMDVAGGNCSFTVSLTVGAREIALAREALADSIRVGTSLDHVDAKPEIIAAPSADGANLVFTVKPPGTTQGFISIRVR